MKTLFTISTITILLFVTLINAEDNMLDRGGKFGNKIFQTQIGPPLVSHDETNNNRSNCRSHIWTRHFMSGRWWNYLIVQKVTAYAYTKTTYGTATRNCGIPFLAKSTFVHLILTNRWSYLNAINFQPNHIDIALLHNTHFNRVGNSLTRMPSSMGNRIMSYHVLDYGWHTVNRTIDFKWK